MKRHFLLAASVVAIFFSVCTLAREGKVGALNGDIVNLRCEALRAAFSQAKDERMATDGKTIVISEIDDFVVVSFIGKKKTYGGGIHVVYAPTKGKVVYSLIEE